MINTDSLKRYFTDEPLWQQKTLEIAGEQLRHMLSAMRHSTGDVVVMFNGDGNDYICNIVKTDKRSITLQVTAAQPNLRRTKNNLHMFCGALKGDGNVNTAAMLSELGAEQLTCFLSLRTVSTGVKSVRLERAAIESAKQCRRAFPLKINATTTFEQALKAAKDSNLKLIAYENLCGNSLASAVNAFLSRVNPCDKTSKCNGAVAPKADKGTSENIFEYAHMTTYPHADMGKCAHVNMPTGSKDMPKPDELAHSFAPMIAEYDKPNGNDKSNDKTIKIAAFTGPEGGFSLEEVELAESYGFVPVSLGRVILKAETAAAAMASGIMCLMGEWD